MKVFIFGQKRIAADVYELARRMGHQVAGVAVPFGDRLAKQAEADGVWGVVQGRVEPAVDLPPELDLIIAAHAHAFIGPAVRDRARLGAIGYHPSLLPRHRGRDAVRWAVHMGDAVTGGTVYRMDDGVDTGPVLAQEHTFIRPGDTAADLWRRELAPLGLRLLERVLAPGFDLAGGTPQDEALATWEPSWERPPLARS